MDITVKNLYIKESPRKIRPVLYGLRGVNAVAAKDRLAFIRKKIAPILSELVKSGIAAAKESDLDTDKLYIKSIFCNEGPRLKRRRFESKGVARRITKRMSHLVLILSDEIKEDNKSEIRNPRSETKKEEKKV